MNTIKEVGIWVRVSTEDQASGEAPENHEKRGRYYAESKGWVVKKVYRLDGVSGKNVGDHPITQEMLEDVRTGKITGLIFSKLARLARSARQLLEFSDFFREHNADLISLQESIDTSSAAGRLFYTIISALSEWEREEIASRVAASIPVRAKSGKPLGGPASYGYKWEGGNGNPKQLVIDEKEAPIRQLMYELFAKVKRKQTVADELNKRGYRTRNNSKFTNTTVERLLRDPSAKGMRRANYTKSLGEGKKWVYKAQKDWEFVPCPVIVSEELWNECNSILGGQSFEVRLGRRSKHLLAGFVFCHCGKKMTINQRKPTYSCPDCSIRILAQDIDEIYYEHLKAFFKIESNPEQYSKELAEMIIERKKELEVSKTMTNELQEKMKSLVEMRLNGELNSEMFMVHHKPLEQQYVALQEQIPQLESVIDSIKMRQSCADVALRDVKDLYECWPTYTFEQRRSIVELITDRIEITHKEISISLSNLPDQKASPPNLPSNKSSKQVNETMPLWLL